MVDIRNSFSTIYRCFIRILLKVSALHVQNFTVSRWQSSGASCRWTAAHSVFSCSVLTFGIMTKFVRLRYIRCWKSGFLPFVRGVAEFTIVQNSGRSILPPPLFHIFTCPSASALAACPPNTRAPAPAATHHLTCAAPETPAALPPNCTQISHPYNTTCSSPR